MAKLVFILLSAIFMMHDSTDGKHHCHKKKASHSEEICPRLNINNGQVEYNGTGVGEIATFSCQENYTLCGHDVVQCNVNEEWDEGLPVCITDYINVTITYEGSSYFFSQDRDNLKTFDEAQEFCENQGGYLLSINSEEELEFVNCVKDKELRVTDNYTYIGLIYQNGTWVWTSGQSISITNYSADPVSSRYCGVLLNGSSNFKWLRMSKGACDSYALGFICEIPL